MEPTAYDGSILGMLAIDSDPFRNGTDCYCIVYTTWDGTAVAERTGSN